MEQIFYFKCNYGTYNQFRYIRDTLNKSNSEAFEDAIIFASMADDRNVRWAYAAEEIVGGPNYDRRVCEELGVKTIKVSIDDSCMTLISEGCSALRTTRPTLIDAAISMYADYIHRHYDEMKVNKWGNVSRKRKKVLYNEELCYKGDVCIDWSREEDLERIMKLKNTNQNDAIIQAIKYLKFGIMNGSERLPSHRSIFNASKSDMHKTVYFRYGESTNLVFRWIKDYYEGEHYTNRDIVYEAIRRYSDILYKTLPGI